MPSGDVIFYAQTRTRKERKEKRGKRPIDVTTSGIAAGQSLSMEEFIIAKLSLIPYRRGLIWKEQDNVFFFIFPFDFCVPNKI
ncbi:hypothetical protein EUGRSUZ_G01848 [Eucalyptus grandis]|uniref:Uncharacterized protein n=2 Tax=Eucalyptus grandis TaxID=71139 RepID=A0ACC3K4A8_EUCGR|nr:hypothetical protein EUGRSUZ_G01848 [Eucalyptus grandis]